MLELNENFMKQNQPQPHKDESLLYLVKVTLPKACVNIFDTGTMFFMSCTAAGCCK